MFKIGIVGAGRLSRVHLRHLSRLPDVSFVVFDHHRERSDLIATEFDAKVVSTFDDLLNEVDAVDIITPNDAHAEYAVPAIRAGKHTFIEKPLDASCAGAKPILDATNDSKATVGVGHVVRYFSMYKRAHDLVKSGGVGTPAAIRMTRGGAMPGGEAGWFGDHARSGGVFIDLGVHDFDWLLWTIGPVKEVFAKSVGAKEGSGPDYGLATLTFANGCIAHVESTWMDPSEGRTAFEVCGDKGMVEYDSRNTATLRSGSKLEQHHLPGDDPFYLQLKGFVDAARAGQPAPVTVAESFAALQVAEACLNSARTNKPVFLNV